MANYNVNNGQTLFDVVLNTTTDINSIYSLLVNNNIPNIIENPIGYSIEYIPQTPTPPTISSSKLSQVVTAKNFYSIPNQSIFDIVLQTYVDINKTYKIIKDSNFSNVLNYPVINKIFIFNPTLVNDAVTTSYLSKRGIVINTVMPITVNYLLQEDGFAFDLEDGSGKIELE